MKDLPPLMWDQRKADADHLRLLAIFHFVIAGLAVIGIGFLLVHYLIFHAIVENPGMWKNAKSAPPPAQIFGVLKWFYLFMAALMMAGGLVNLLSGIFLQRRTNRIFSLIIAGFDCVQFPLGTVLGVFTFIVLLRDSVRELYEAPTLTR